MYNKQRVEELITHLTNRVNSLAGLIGQCCGNEKDLPIIKETLRLLTESVALLAQTCAYLAGATDDVKK